MQTGNSLVKKREKEIRKVSAVFLIPALLFIAVFIIYPIFNSFQTSLYEWNGITAGKKFIALDN